MGVPEQPGDPGSLTGRLFRDMAGALELLTVYLGERLGLYQALHADVPATSAELATRTGKSPRWNFHKYVIDRDGNAAGTFASSVEPDNRELLALLDKLLGDKPAAQKG